MKHFVIASFGDLIFLETSTNSFLGLPCYELTEGSLEEAVFYSLGLKPGEYQVTEELDLAKAISETEIASYAAVCHVRVLKSPSLRGQFVTAERVFGGKKQGRRKLAAIPLPETDQTIIKVFLTCKRERKDHPICVTPSGRH